MCEAAPGSVEAIKTAAQVITLRESRPPWGFVEAQLLWKLKEISDRICKAVWKGFTEQMLADYSFKSKETPSIPSLPTQTTRALPWAFSDGNTAQKMTPPLSGPQHRGPNRSSLPVSPPRGSWFWVSILPRRCHLLRSGVVAHSDFSPSHTPRKIC